MTTIFRKSQIDKKELREIIFNNNNEKKWLENLLHPLIYAKIKELIKNIKNPYM